MMAKVFIDKIFVWNFVNGSKIPEEQNQSLSHSDGRTGEEENLLQDKLLQPCFGVVRIELFHRVD